MSKKYPKGTMDFSSCEETLVVKWKDNKVVTVISNDRGIEPKCTVSRFSKETKRREVVKCPDVV